MLTFKTIHCNIFHNDIKVLTKAQSLLFPDDITYTTGNVKKKYEGLFDNAKCTKQLIQSVKELDNISISESLNELIEEQPDVVLGALCIHTVSESNGSFYIGRKEHHGPFDFKYFTDLAKKTKCPTVVHWCYGEIKDGNKSYDNAGLMDISATGEVTDFFHLTRKDDGPEAVQSYCERYQLD